MSGPRPAPVCNRCRQGFAAEGDSWCTACTSWEALGRELSGHWDQSGCRIIATDLVLNCVRQVRALRSLGAGLSRIDTATTVTSSPGAGSPGAPRDTAREKAREPLPRARSAAPPPPLAKSEVSDAGEAEDNLDGESEEEEEDERSPTPVHRPIHSGSRRPPEPDRPPAGHQGYHKKSEAGSSRASGHRAERERSRHGGHKRRRSNRRGGRKHQRLHRLAGDPTIRVHRKPPAGYWDLSCFGSGASHLDRSILQQ